MTTNRNQQKSFRTLLVRFLDAILTHQCYQQQQQQQQQHYHHHQKQHQQQQQQQQQVEKYID